MGTYTIWSQYSLRLRDYSSQFVNMFVQTFLFLNEPVQLRNNMSNHHLYTYFFIEFWLYDLWGHLSCLFMLCKWWLLILFLSCTGWFRNRNIWTNILSYTLLSLVNDCDCRKHLHAWLVVRIPHFLKVEHKIKNSDQYLVHYCQLFYSD